MDTKAVIFDMDGVLIDSWELHYQSWKVTSKKYGFEIDRIKFGNHFGQTCDSFAKQLCNDNDTKLSKDEIDEWFTKKDEYYREKFQEDFQEHKGVTKLINDLNQNGFRTGVGSSAPSENIQLLVDLMPNGEMLQDFISADDVREGKPNPEVFLLAAKKLGVPAIKSAVIEDSLHGLQAAKSAGMVAIGITGTFDRETLSEYADLVIDELDEVNAAKISELIEENCK